MSTRKEINYALFYSYKTNRKGLIEVNQMGHFVDPLFPRVKTKESKPWNEERCKDAIQEYAEIIAELNIEEEYASKRHKKFVKLIIDRLSERKYKSERELENYFKSIRFDVDKELQLAGY